jgi:hypothetical protein
MAVANSGENLKDSDAIEERIVEEMRLLGREAMQGWAETQVKKFVTGCLGDEGSADDGAGSGPFLDNDGLSQPFVQLLSGDTRGGIDRATRSNRHHRGD